MSNNNNLENAKKEKNDEFYTQLPDIENEMKNYIKHFENKIIYCNCDNYKYSNFYKYFKNNFYELKLKKIITTSYSNGIMAEYNGKEKISKLKGNGDFRNNECVEILKKSDIIITNPPFSLFRDFIKILIEYDKKFIIVGSENAITYKDFFPLIKNNKVWKGINRLKQFKQPDGSMKKFGNIIWFTNIDTNKRHEKISLYKKYNKDEYKQYDNYKAIEVSKVSNIPYDYDGIMGVPITFLDKYNPEQFEIIGSDYEVKTGTLKNILKENWNGKTDRAYLNNKRMYSRILIKKKDN